MSHVSYQLQLPPQWTIYPVFHIDLLTPYCKTMTHGENYLRPPPKLVDNEEEYEVEAILDSRRFGRGCKLQYLIKWEGYPDSENQWEDANNIHSDNLVHQFQKQHPSKEMHLRARRNAKSFSSSSMSSPHTDTLELDATPIPVVSTVAEAQHMFPTPEPGWLSLDSTQTVQVDLDSGTAIEGSEDDKGSSTVGMGTTSASLSVEGRSEVPPAYCHCDVAEQEYCHCLK